MTDESSAAASTVRVRPHRRWWAALRFLLASVLLVLVLRQVDWGQFFILISDVQPAWLALVFLVNTVDRFWMAGKWWYLLQHLGVHVSWFDTILHYYSGGLIGAAAQWQLSGDIARAVALGKKTGQPGMVAASVIFEKVAGLSATGLWAVFAATLLNGRWHFWPPVPGLVVGGLAAIVLVAAPFLVGSPLGAPVFAALGQRLPQTALRRMANRMETILHQFRASQRATAVFVLLTLGEQVVPVVTVLLLSHALGLSLTPFMILSVVPISAFVSRLPISVEALGVREAMFVYLLGLYGLTAAGALALALAVRVMDLVAISAGALVCTGIARTQQPDDYPPAPGAPSTAKTPG